MTVSGQIDLTTLASLVDTDETDTVAAVICGSASSAAR